MAMPDPPQNVTKKPSPSLGSEARRGERPGIGDCGVRTARPSILDRPASNAPCPATCSTPATVAWTPDAWTSRMGGLASLTADGTFRIVVTQNGGLAYDPVILSGAIGTHLGPGAVGVAFFAPQ